MSICPARKPQEHRFLIFRWRTGQHHEFEPSRLEKGAIWWTLRWKCKHCRGERVDDFLDDFEVMELLQISSMKRVTRNGKVYGIGLWDKEIPWGGRNAKKN